MAGVVNTKYVSAMDSSYKDGVARPYIQVGQTLWVADDSGVQKVEVFKHTKKTKIYRNTQPKPKLFCSLTLGIRHFNSRVII